jgi:hypothetical protein
MSGRSPSTRNKRRAINRKTSKKKAKEEATLEDDLDKAKRRTVHG